MKKRNRHFSGWLIVFFASLTFCFSCKKSANVLPAGRPPVAFNFFAATDVMNTAYGAKVTAGRPGETFIYVDTLNKFKNRVNWGFDQSGETEYPTVDGGFMNFAQYSSYDGSHRLFFTDTANRVVLDTLITPMPWSYNCIYLADAPAGQQNQLARYIMFSVREDRAGVPDGKVGVHFIHLSPDAGELTAALQKADGSLTGILPAKLSFGQSTSYQYFSSDDAVGGLIKFRLANPDNGALIGTGVPFQPGRSYIIVVTGFLNDQQRLMATGRNSDGSNKYATISISNNLRAITRTTY